VRTSANRRRLHPVPVVSEKDRARRVLSLDQMCPYCGMLAGKTCKTRSGVTRSAPHEARMRRVDPAEVDRRVAKRSVEESRRRRGNRLVGSALAAVVLAGAATFSLHNSNAEPEWLVAPRLPSFERTIVGWEPLHCADGWPSSSIGERGACSHHGGVVGGTIYDETVTPAVEGVLAPERTDWGRVTQRAFWSLTLGGLGGWWVWRRVADSRIG